MVVKSVYLRVSRTSSQFCLPAESAFTYFLFLEEPGTTSTIQLYPGVTKSVPGHLNTMASIDLDSESKTTTSRADVYSGQTLQLDKEDEQEDNPANGATIETQVTSEYPQGHRLVFIVVAIILTILLASLDQVSDRL